MTFGSQANLPAVSPSVEEVAEQIERILSSPGFRASVSVQRLLRYLGQHAMDHPGQTVKEYELATQGLGRGGEFDSRVDAVVRLSVSRLRAKLAEYYLHEGAGDPILLDIPKGAYVLFSFYRDARSAAKTEPRGSEKEEAPPASRRVFPGRAILAAAWAVAAVSCLVCAVLFWQNAHLKSQIAPRESFPHTEHLWKGLFQGGRSVQLVTSDANLLFLAQFMRRAATLSEYRAQGYPASLINEHVADASGRRVLNQFMATFFTTSQDGTGAASIAGVLDRYRIPFRTVYARDARLEPDTEDNVILLGNRMGNPWVELFDHKVNFVYEWDAQQDRGVLHNRNPRAGEKDVYAPKPGKSYATVVYAARPNGKGSVLMFGGTDMTGVEVGARFLTEEPSVAILESVLGVDSRREIPHFELLLSARHLTDIPYNVEVVAYRVASAN